jgi:alkylation response protein AidB-like acyl-CoA dehydrogenase
MPLYLTEDQAMLRDTAREFMASEGAIGQQLRKYRDMNCKDGFGHALWRQFGEWALPASSSKRRTAGWGWAMSRRELSWRRSGVT